MKKKDDYTDFVTIDQYIEEEKRLNHKGKFWASCMIISAAVMVFFVILVVTLVGTGSVTKNPLSIMSWIAYGLFSLLIFSAFKFAAYEEKEGRIKIELFKLILEKDEREN